MRPQAFLRLPQLVRFLLLGGLAAAINWLVRFPLSLAMPFSAAVFVAYLIGMSAGFTLYRAYVFPNSPRPIAMQAALFLIVNAVGAVVVMTISVSLLDHILPLIGWWLLPEAVAHGTGIAVGAVVNFAGHKYLSFRVHPGRAGNLT
ncbi:GtrA family protein [Pelagibacterium sp. 26DY04]|uniref:GtrA family protein n=1 Tax=Pelagibacterium sp. 26DY04 TaxID=2967130 RepID=UPI002814E06D|nr:GtrA family protein [Pelagibacterium sp. 26DY04]WMT87625.1 GtrA family protein [Pelagibacterium sp. 26DY04]